MAKALVQLYSIQQEVPRAPRGQNISREAARTRTLLLWNRWLGGARSVQCVQQHQGEDNEAALSRALNMMTMTLMMMMRTMTVMMMMMTPSTGTSSREQAALSRARVVAHFAAHS